MASQPVDANARGLSADGGLTSLADALDHPEPAVRARAVFLISELVGAGASDLLQTMIYDPCAEVRRAVARASVRVGTTDMVAALIVALADPDDGVRGAAAEAIARVTGHHVAPTDAVDSREVDAVKQWWKEKRFLVLSKE
jgi:HEAT repeat protein